MCVCVKLNYHKIFVSQGYSPTSGKPSPKFTNYTLDVEEMMRLVTGLGDRVRERKLRAHAHKLFTQ